MNSCRHQTGMQAGVHASLVCAADLLVVSSNQYRDTGLLLSN